jgi:uncharacterized protein
MDREKRLDTEDASFDRQRELDLQTKAAPTAAASSCGIAIMAKASTPGLAKTRLVPPLSYEGAAALNTAFLRDVADNVLLASSLAARHAGIVGYAAYGPPGSQEFFRHTLPQSFGLIAAWRADFGACLLHAIEEVLARGHAGAVVLNADSPTLPTALLNEAAEMLARPGDRAVLGPSSDGGYYLLGLKVAHRRMFEDVAWSTERVAEQTLLRASEIGLPVHVLPEWYDVDDVQSLRRLHAELYRHEAGSDSHAAPTLRPHRASHSAALLDRLWASGDSSRSVEDIAQNEKAAV